MGIFDKIFGKKQKLLKQEQIEKPEKELTADTQFVEQFKNKGGKFLYCTKEEEVLDYLDKVFKENDWVSVLCFDKKLKQFLNVIDIPKEDEADVFFTTCEHLLAEDGSILFSSNQLQEAKLVNYPINFIVFATTSQLIHTKDKALSSIKHRFKKEIPTNISAIKDFIPVKKDPNFLNYGNTNSKNLYLLLLENL